MMGGGGNRHIKLKDGVLRIVSLKIQTYILLRITLSFRFHILLVQHFDDSL